MRVLIRTLALVGVVSMVAAACGGDEPTGQGPTAAGPKRGGSIVVAAEQWPECPNLINQCSGATWSWYVLGQQLARGAMELDASGNYIASPMIEEAPTIENGGVTQNPFTVRYKIKQDAVWEDGSPITWEDFDFTFKAIVNTTGSYSKASYEPFVGSVEQGATANDVVINFKAVYTDWPSLFGGVYQGLFKKAAFPDADPEAPNLETPGPWPADSVPFSNGPWVLQSFSEDQAVFTRNDRYNGPKALLDQVTFVPRGEISTEINSVKTGEVAAAYPQPGASSIIDEVQGVANVKAVGADGAYYEALWFNNSKVPDEVREAFMYAVDRQSIIDNIIKLNSPNSIVLNCGFPVVPSGPWCEQKPFEQFTYDPAKSVQILEAGGWDCSKVPDSPCTKGGKELDLEYSTVAGNERREATQQLVQESAKPAGFKLHLKNYPSTELFSDILPKSNDWDVTEYASGGSPDPVIYGSLACEAVPNEANGFGGGNLPRWCNEQADPLMKQADAELDNSKRLETLNQVFEMQANDHAWLPLFVLPNVLIYRTDKIAGPVDEFIVSNLGAFWNLHEWHIP